MFKRILVAIDGSPASAAGLRSAITFATDQKATLVALHVVDDGALPMDFEGIAYPPKYIDAYFAASTAGGRKLLDKAADVARDRGLKTEAVLVRSRGKSVARVIVEQARKLRADAIVIGTHGRRGLKRMLMGSDAEEVVREANVPVMLVRGHARKARKASKSAKR